MANIFDISKYIIEKTNEITSMKLQKLVYYSQVWFIVWEEEPLFDDKIEAWDSGAVIPILHKENKGYFKLNKDSFKKGESSKLSILEKENIDKVILHYGDKNSQWLSDLIHMEEPWNKAKRREKNSIKEEITLADIHEYYSGL